MCYVYTTHVEQTAIVYTATPWHWYDITKIPSRDLCM